MISKIKIIFWKFRYAIHFGDRLGLKWVDSWGYAETSLENINYDTEECPFDIADEDIEVWKSECDVEEVI